MVKKEEVSVAAMKVRSAPALHVVSEKEEKLCELLLVRSFPWLCVGSYVNYMQVERTFQLQWSLEHHALAPIAFLAWNAV